jgi:hypothetical protein
MHINNQKILEEIGCQLDNNIFPLVKNGGIVTPSDSAVSLSTMGEEKEDERQRKRRSKTRARNGATGRKGASNQTTPIICTDFQTQYESELSAILEAYPKTQVWRQPDGLLLLTESALFTDNQQPATFFIMIPFAKKEVVKGWGFWTSAISIDWVGPRHTNFPDGSICAFERSDGTWVKGDPLVQLIDLYSLWAFRHLCLKTFGRWPGRQAVHFPYERILELRSDEYCGCNISDKLYSECCQNKDLRRNRIADAIHFAIESNGCYRKPPEIITNFIWNQINPPQINDLLSL